MRQSTLILCTTASVMEATYSSEGMWSVSEKAGTHHKRYKGATYRLLTANLSQRGNHLERSRRRFDPSPAGAASRHFQEAEARGTGFQLRLLPGNRAGRNRQEEH